MAKEKTPEPYTQSKAFEDSLEAIREAEKQHKREFGEAPADRWEREFQSKKLKGRLDVKTVLKLPEARRLLWRILEMGGVYQSSFAVDPNVTNFNEGKRYVGLKTLEIILDAEPGAYLQMQREHASDVATEQANKRGEE